MACMTFSYVHLVGHETSSYVNDGTCRRCRRTREWERERAENQIKYVRLVKWTGNNASANWWELGPKTYINFASIFRLRWWRAKATRCCVRFSFRFDYIVEGPAWKPKCSQNMAKPNQRPNSLKCIKYTRSAFAHSLAHSSTHTRCLAAVPHFWYAFNFVLTARWRWACFPQ